MKFSAKDCQQIVTDGSRIVSIHAGPMVVRVHESRDADNCWGANRYYLSVDLKFWEFDAMKPFGWLGCTKAEATRDANELAAKIAQLVNSIEATKASSFPGKDILLARHEATLKRITDKYQATVTI